MLNDKTILITGGTGSLGKALTKSILQRWPGIKKLIIFSRDEQKQYSMAQDYPPHLFPQMRFFIGDVRDFERVKRAFKGVNYVVHTAAMKHIPIAEYNPMECVKTNILGAEKYYQCCS
jgi:FlaA1/EpsC-like NDP-sugar epimerase